MTIFGWNNTDKAWTQLVPVLLVYSRRKQHAIHVGPPRLPVATRSQFATVAFNAGKASHACTEMRRSRRGKFMTSRKAKMDIVFIVPCK